MSTTMAMQASVHFAHKHLLHENIVGLPKKQYGHQGKRPNVFLVYTLPTHLLVR